MLFCDECGQQMKINNDGTSNHTVPDEADMIDYDADVEHVAFTREEEQAA